MAVLPLVRSGAGEHFGAGLNGQSQMRRPSRGGCLVPPRNAALVETSHARQASLRMLQAHVELIIASLCRRPTRNQCVLKAVVFIRSRDWPVLTAR